MWQEVISCKNTKIRETELRLPFKDGLSFEIKRFSLIKSSGVELQEERILKSSRDAEWPILEKCDRTLDSEGLRRFLPVRAEILKWSQTHVCKWWVIWLTYNVVRHWGKSGKGQNSQRSEVSCCTALYVGQATRHLCTWVLDYLGRGGSSPKSDRCSVYGWHSVSYMCIHGREVWGMPLGKFWKLWCLKMLFCAFSGHSEFILNGHLFRLFSWFSSVIRFWEFTIYKFQLNLQKYQFPIISYTVTRTHKHTCLYMYSILNMSMYRTFIKLNSSWGKFKQN